MMDRLGVTSLVSQLTSMVGASTEKDAQISLTQLVQEQLAGVSSEQKQGFDEVNAGLKAILEFLKQKEKRSLSGKVKQLFGFIRDGAKKIWNSQAIQSIPARLETIKKAIGSVFKSIGSLFKRIADLAHTAEEKVGHELKVGGAKLISEADKLRVRAKTAMTKHYAVDKGVKEEAEAAKLDAFDKIKSLKERRIGGYKAAHSAFQEGKGLSGKRDAMRSAIAGAPKAMREAARGLRGAVLGDAKAGPASPGLVGKIKNIFKGKGRQQ